LDDHLFPAVNRPGANRRKKIVYLNDFIGVN
jgi:hypothetical protein